MACSYPWTQLDNNIEVFGDANFAECVSTSRAMEWSVCESMVQKYEILALSIGESGLAAVVRAATEGMGLHSILSDFGLFGHVAIRSDATAAIGMVHRLASGSSTFSCWRSLVSASRSFGQISSLQKCQVWRIRLMHKQSTVGQNHCCAIRKRAIRYLWMDEF